MNEKENLDINKTDVRIQSACNKTESPKETDIDDNRSNVKEHEKITSEVKAQEYNQEQQKNIDNDLTKNAAQAPVAPPRRKKKNKKQVDKTEVSVLIGIMYVVQGVG